jgi:hypothetical protein
MKKRSGVYKLMVTAVLLLSATTIVAATDDLPIEKKKKYSKSYTLAGNEKVSISNQFGEVHIITWDNKEVKVDITVIAQAKTDEKAQQVLDIITIKDYKNESGVFFETKLLNKEEKGDKKGRWDQSMQINYEVYMPSSNPLDLENSFGKLIVPDMTGPVDISSKFGELTAGKLSHVKNLEVEYGTATVESVTDANVVIKFSQAQINKMSGAIKTLQSYSGVKLGIDNSTTSFSTKNEFTDLLLEVSTDLSANFDIYTNFSELKNQTDFKIKEEAEDNSGMKFDHQYNGKSGNASINFKVKSNFGDVTIGHSLPFDVTEDRDEKEKPERKERKEKKEKTEKKEKVTVI